MTTLEMNCRNLAELYNRLNKEAVALEKEVTRVQESEDYSYSYKKRTLEELTAKRDSVIKAHMNTMQAATDRAVENIRAEHKIDLANNAAHQVAVSNALKMIELGGPNLTPEQLQGLANTFIDAGDRQTLDIMQTICLNRCPDAFHTAFGAGIEDDVSRLQRFGSLLAKGIGISTRSAVASTLAQEFLNINGMGDIVLELKEL